MDSRAFVRGMLTLGRARYLNPGGALASRRACAGRGHRRLRRLVGFVAEARLDQERAAASFENVRAHVVCPFDRARRIQDALYPAKGLVLKRAALKRRAVAVDLDPCPMTGNPPQTDRGIRRVRLRLSPAAC